MGGLNKSNFRGPPPGFERGGCCLIVVAAATLVLLLGLVFIAGCAGHYDWIEAEPEAVAMIKAVGLDPGATAEDSEIPPLLLLASWLHHYGVTGLLPSGGRLATVEWCPPADGSEPVGYESRIHHRQPSRQESLTPWIDAQEVVIYIPPSGDVDSTWVDVRAYDAEGRLSPWSLPSCIYGDSLCTTIGECGP